MTDMVDLSLTNVDPHPPASAPASAPASPPDYAPVYAPAAETGDLDARLTPALEELDHGRKAQRGEFFFRIAVTVLGVAALAVASGLAMVGALGAVPRDLGVLVYVIPPLAGGGLGYWANLSRRRYMTDFKQQTLPAIANALGDFHYDAAGKIGAQRLSESTLLPPHDEYHSEDLFFGHHKGVEVALAEVRLTREQGSGNDRKTVTAFKGLFALLSLQKRIAGKTVVRLESRATSNWLGGTFGGLQRYVPEGLAFDGRFEVYTSEKAEARRLLTPSLLELLSALAVHLGSGGLQAGFYEDQFFIMVPNAEDLFEAPSIFTSVLKNAGLNRIGGEFRDVLAMIDGMDLDERTAL